MEVSSDSFGGRTNFNVGDIVCWTVIGEKLTGVVSQLREAIAGGRKVVFADVYCFENKINCEVLTLNLKLLAKNDSIQQEN